MKKRLIYQAATVGLVMALLLGLTVACSSTPKKASLTNDTLDQWNATVEETIAEPDRAARLKELGREMIDIANSLTGDVDELQTKAIVLHENYNATREDEQELIGDFVERRNTAFAQYRDVIFAMRSEVNAEEWKALTK